MYLVEVEEKVFLCQKKIRIYEFLMYIFNFMLVIYMITGPQNLINICNSFGISDPNTPAYKIF